MTAYKIEKSKMAQQDAAIIERRLRPIYGNYFIADFNVFSFFCRKIVKNELKFSFFIFIYGMSNVTDALENKGYKKALHEAEKVLKKTPNLLCALTLKGFALVRLGRTNEGESIIKQVVDEKSCDDLTLQVLAYVFKDLDDCK